MTHLHFFTETHLQKIIRKRTSETKLGEKVSIIAPCQTMDELYHSLKHHTCKYVLIGFAEDIGVRANFGRGGAYSAWQPALESVLNIQSNDYFDGSELLVLGSVNVDDLLEKAKDLNTKNDADLMQLRTLTAAIDERIYPIIATIIKAGKKVIAVGGGHNNAYPLIKGVAQATNEKLNVANIDAHTDFRPLEGRHSGNGFSYAFEENLLTSYHAIGIHENYCTNHVIETFKKNPQLKLYTYEDIFLRQQIDFSEMSTLVLAENKKGNWALEIDLDSIQNIPSSAKTSSGMLPVDVRKFMYQFASQAQPSYLHIAEGAPVLSHIKTDNKTGKLIAYLISDYIKATHAHTSKSEAFS
jgi:formiminoglutamase